MCARLFRARPADDEEDEGEEELDEEELYDWQVNKYDGDDDDDDDDRPGAPPRAAVAAPRRAPPSCAPLPDVHARDPRARRPRVLMLLTLLRLLCVAGHGPPQLLIDMGIFG